MAVSTQLITVFGLHIDSFIFAAGIVIFVIVFAGVILLARNIRPVLGLLLLILAMAMVIGLALETKTIKRELKEFYEKLAD